MATIRGRNIAGPAAQAALEAVIRDGDTLEDCNLAQGQPGAPIFAGVRGLTFRRCNLARAVVPDDAGIEDCNTSQRPLPPEPEPTEPPVEVERADLWPIAKAASISDDEATRRLTIRFCERYRIDLDSPPARMNGESPR